MPSVEIPVSPGVASAVLFIFADIVFAALLDIVVCRAVCLEYYRAIGRGQPVFVSSANIPGLTHYLLHGRKHFLTNTLATFVKVVFLSIILIANLNITSKTTRTVHVVRDATFEFDPSDENISTKNTTMVRTLTERAIDCRQSSTNGTTIMYYPIRFNLTNKIILKDTDISKEATDRNKYEIEHDSIICMSPNGTTNSQYIAKVIGCYQKAKDQSCFSAQSSYIPIPKADIPRFKLARYLDFASGIGYNYIDYEKDVIRTLWPHFMNATLTCLMTEIGMIAEHSSSSEITICLLMAQEANTTIVEYYRLFSKGQTPGVFQTTFILHYPGVIFEGTLRFGRLAAAQYISGTPLFEYPTYVAMSGDLISQASRYRYEREKLGIIEPISGETVTVVSRSVVCLITVALLVIAVSLLVLVVMFRKDNRPQFNTINGISSILREENEITGNSFLVGPTAVVGLHVSREDTAKFGPLRKADHCLPFEQTDGLTDFRNAL